MNFLNKKIIIIALACVIILIIIGLIVFRNNPLSPLNNQNVPTPEITGEFTGYAETEFTEDELAEIDQNTQLRESSPYTGDGFTITYDYETFTYQVTANDQQALTNFNTFIATNYPAIPREKFIINNQSNQSNLTQFLIKQTPIETSTFAVRSENNSYFIVTIKDQSRGRSDFDAWLQGFNLTQQQISSLDIRIQ